MKDINTIMEGLGLTGTLLSEFVKSMPEAVLGRRRAEGFWTVADHVRHLADVQPMLFERLFRFKEEDRPVFKPHIPAEDEGLTADPPAFDMDVILEKFNVWREKQIALMGSLREPVWDKTADHPEYTLYTPYILARHILMHDHWHMYRMEELWLTRDDYLTALPG